ncbi:hypothetical protein E3N88_19544 [Mikania micrantha]|uniref:non-specific serine/threonine protein kinase n=1 Tax=Mikania micrantha TaxID=192012 RepID=A0A5N6NR99_9ASTR|nr:hypothetical protein E3N88_19544 [Mikania micrantha]
MPLFTSFYYVLTLQVALTLAMVHAQDDQSDAGFIDSGINQEILSTYKSDTQDIQLSTLRSFPQNTRNCYTLRPKQGKGNRYLIRARFTYGNYDFKGQPPQFDLYLGSDHWIRVDFNVSLAKDSEIIHLASSDYIHVCLVNIGLGYPFISALELRLLDNTMYAHDLRSLVLFTRINFGTSETVRYGDDTDDRIWYPEAFSGITIVQTSSPISLGSSTKENLPSKVMSTAIIPTNPTYDLLYSWRPTSINDVFFMYLYFAEIETLQSNQTREFNVLLNRVIWTGGPISPIDHTTSTYFTSFYNSTSYELRLRKTPNSTLPPMCNAIELYNPIRLQQQQTDDQDAASMWSIKTVYGLKRIWQGDPCVPNDSIWEGVNCSYNDTDNPRIISLNLSYSRISGEIAPALANLTMIQSLDLSYNNLTGSVPKFLASLDFLRILNLTGNNFTSPLPEELLEKKKNGQLLLSIEADSNQSTYACHKGSCKKNKNKKVVILVVASIAALIILLTTLTVLWITKRRRTQVPSTRYRVIEPRNQRFKYSEVQKITNNFTTVIGKGGSGTVFKGLIGNTQVAVKMLSELSAQGYKEFQAEARLLMRADHKNIISLTGYCDEHKHKGIIYEYMANGNLGMHLFDASQNVLSWIKRIEIGYDAAQGLEYIHHHRRPAIVHRDVKCSNILLDERLQAKLADFGLSRAFATESATHVSTVMAGTYGYLDPEYFTTNRLTEKSDVYSFGVVLLELATGRQAKPAIPTDLHIVGRVRSMIENGSIENIIDPRLQGNFEVNTAWQVVKLAMRCVDNSSVNRPTMKNVVIDLKNSLEISSVSGNPANGSLSFSFVPPSHHATMATVVHTGAPTTIPTRRRDGDEAESSSSDHTIPRVSVQPTNIAPPVIPFSSGVMATSTLTFPYGMSSPLLPPYYPQTPFIPPFNHTPSQTSVYTNPLTPQPRPSGSFVSSGPNPVQGTIPMVTNPLTPGGNYGTILMIPYAPYMPNTPMPYYFVFSTRGGPSAHEALLANLRTQLQFTNISPPPAINGSNVVCPTYNPNPQAYPFVIDYNQPYKPPELAMTSKFVAPIALADLQINGTTEALKVAGFIHGVRDKHPIRKLHGVNGTPEDMNSLMTIAKAYVQQEKSVTASSEWESRKAERKGGSTQAPLTPTVRKSSVETSERLAYHRRDSGRYTPYTPREVSIVAQRKDEKHETYPTLTKTPSEIWRTEGLKWEQPRPLKDNPARDKSKYCDYHRVHGHDTNDCWQLKKQIEKVPF